MPALRQKECASCKRAVTLPRKRFQSMVAAGRLPLCAECRRMMRTASGEVGAESTGVARTSQLLTRPSDVLKGLVRKRRCAARRRRPLASRSLSRVASGT